MEMLKSVLTRVASSFGHHKTFEEALEEQNTRKVTVRGFYGVTRTYTYGKEPGTSLVRSDNHPEGEIRLVCAAERDLAIVRDHIAICSREVGSRGGLCEMCRKLDNPQRRAFLVRLYSDDRPLEQAGFNVGDAVETSVLNQPATSQYLRQLAELYLICRERHGRRVFYTPRIVCGGSSVGEIGEMLRQRWRENPKDMAFSPIFHVMMGPFRARVVRLLASGGSGRVGDLADRFGKKAYEIIRDLDAAVKCGVLVLDSEDADGVYRYVTPADPIARRVVELS